MNKLNYSFENIACGQMWLNLPSTLISIYLHHITISTVTPILFRYLYNEKVSKAFLWKLWKIETKIIYHLLKRAWWQVPIANN